VRLCYNVKAYIVVQVIIILDNSTKQQFIEKTFREQVAISKLRVSYTSASAPSLFSLRAEKELPVPSQEPVTPPQ
jgi:hypothetical protein